MWILDAIVEPIWWSRDGRARMRELLGVELRQVSMEMQKEPQRWAGQGRQGRAATVDGRLWRSKRDKLLLGLADKVSKDG